jgi:uncharacterized membrane protein
METQIVTSEEKILSAIGYIGILFLVPMMLKRNSTFAQFHAKQGAILFLAWIANSIIAIVPILGWIIAFFGSIVLIVLMILGIIKSLAGEIWEMPLLADYAKKIKL